MPLFEFNCDNCKERFEILCRNVSDKEADCPHCGGIAKKVFSTFRSGKSAGGTSGLSSSSCGG